MLRKLTRRGPRSIVSKRTWSSYYIEFMSLLDVAKKYEVPSIRPFVVNELEKDWPTDLTEWIFKHGELTQLEALIDAWSELRNDVYPDEHFPEPAVAVRIAIDYHIPSILPAAFYCLSDVEITDDWDRYHGCDDWKFGDQTAHDIEENPIIDLRRTARWSLLDRDTLYLALLGRTELKRRQRDFFTLTSPSKMCLEKTCYSALQKLQTRYHKSYRDLKSHPGPLQSLIQLLQDLGRDEGICYFCSKELRREIDTEVRSIWHVLPRIFALHTIPGFGECSSKC